MNQTNNRGFTLIGVVMASIIVGVLAIAVAQVLVRAEPVLGLGREQFIATNLAREGLELVRVVRDTNWFSQDDRSRWLANGLCDDQNTSYLDTDRQFTLDPAVVRSSTGVGDVAEPQLYTQANGLWVHDQSAGSATVYQRVISLDCSNKSSDPAFVSVTSTVSWQSRGQNRSVVVKEKLYNWLPS